MNKTSVCIFLLVLSACSSGPLKQDVARKIIARELSVPVKHVKVMTTSGVSNTVVVDATVQFAFTMQRGADGQWHIIKISRVPGQWEDPSFLLKSALSRSLHTALLTELQK